jgi:hypothetical protein
MLARPESGARVSTPSPHSTQRAVASRAGQDYGGDHGAPFKIGSVSRSQVA